MEMKKEFDLNAYAKAFQKFIIGIDSINGDKVASISKIIHPLAEILMLGRIELVVYSDSIAEDQNASHNFVLHTNETYSMENPYSTREIIGAGGICYFTLYPVNGELDWYDDDCYERLDALIKVLKTFALKMFLHYQGAYYAVHEQEFGMYNVAFLTRRLTEYSAQKKLGEFFVCYFNVKRLSLINAEFGRDGGTSILKQYIKNLGYLLDDNREFVSRVGGDNFIGFFLKTHIDKILHYLNGTTITYGNLDDKHLFITSWTGVYELPDFVNAPTDILDRVSFAKNVAKKTRSETAVFFSEEMMNQIEESKRILFLFPDALRRQEFFVYYQPKISLKENKIIGAEALCRWVHDGQMMMPGKFIPAIEESSRVCQLDFYMLNLVCEDIKKWLGMGLKPVRISVNFSRRHLDDPKILEHILNFIDMNHVPHEYIEIELTETSNDVNFTDLKALVEGLRNEGISTAVDDFGCGYSSLNLIRELPWNVLKLDKSFIDPNPDKENDRKAKIMFKNVISMAHEMGMTCLTEGVETESQVQYLKDNNCFMAQGFLFDKPMSVEEFEKKLEKAE